jgi:hypothetical protein
MHPDETICPGMLIWYDVADDDRFAPAAVLVCSHCREVFVAGQPLDPRHAFAPLLREGLGS